MRMGKLSINIDTTDFLMARVWDFLGVSKRNEFCGYLYDFMTLFPMEMLLEFSKNPWIVTQNQVVEAPKAFSRGFFAAPTCPGFNSPLSISLLFTELWKKLGQGCDLSAAEWRGQGVLWISQGNFGAPSCQLGWIWISEIMEIGR